MTWWQATVTWRTRRDCQSLNCSESSQVKSIQVDAEKSNQRWICLLQTRRYVGIVREKWNEMKLFHSHLDKLNWLSERMRKRNVRPWHDTTRKQQFNWPLNDVYSFAVWCVMSFFFSSLYSREVRSLTHNTIIASLTWHKTIFFLPTGKDYTDVKTQDFWEAKKKKLKEWLNDRFRLSFERRTTK